MDWLELKDLLISAAETVLKGEPLDSRQLKRNKMAGVKRTLAALKADHPTIADQFAQPFRSLEVLLALLAEHASVPSPKDS